MGKGTEEAAKENPEHAQVIDDFKDQLIICLVQKLAETSEGGIVKVPCSDVDNTGGSLMHMAIVDRTFNFKITRKH
jgi:hypothetical protein